MLYLSGLESRDHLPVYRLRSLLSEVQAKEGLGQDNTADARVLKQHYVYELDVKI